jgi:hypothetical protein
MSDNVATERPNGQRNLTRLTRELFEAHGVAVAWHAELRPSQLIPSVASKAEIFRVGEEGIELINLRQDWRGWTLCLPAVGVIHAEAVAEAGGKTRGARFTEAYKRQLSEHPKFAFLGELGSAPRSRLLACAKNLDSINTWLSTLPYKVRLGLNHPDRVLAAWRRSQKPRGEHPEQPKKPTDSIATMKAFAELLNGASLKDMRQMGAALLAQIRRKLAHTNSQDQRKTCAALLSGLQALLAHANLKQKQKVCASLFNDVQAVMALLPSTLLDEFRRHHLSTLSQEHGGKARIDRLIRNSGGKVARLSPTSH